MFRLVSSLALVATAAAMQGRVAEPLVGGGWQTTERTSGEVRNVVLTISDAAFPSG